MTNSEIMPKAQKYKSIVRNNIETVSTRQYSRVSRDLKINTLGSMNQGMQRFQSSQKLLWQNIKLYAKSNISCSLFSLVIAQSLGQDVCICQTEARSHETSPPSTSGRFSSKICTKQSDAGTKWTSSFSCINEDKTKHHSKLSLLLHPLLAYLFARDTITKV